MKQVYIFTIGKISIKFLYINLIVLWLKNGDSVVLVGFGTFSVRDRAARTGRNPQTGAEIQIAAARVPAFKAGKALKTAVNNR